MITNGYTKILSNKVFEHRTLNLLVNSLILPLLNSRSDLASDLN